MAKAKDQKGEVLEVEILLTPDVLENNPDIKEHYDSKTNVLSYDIGDNVPKDFKEELDAFLKTSNPNELASFNPIMKALSDLQTLKVLKYDEKNEKETVQSFKDGKKYIGSFNTSLTGIKKILKDPHIEYNRKVDAIYNFFKTESDNTKNALEVNFKVHLDKEEAKKKAADAKKKAAELAEIESLASANREQAEKLNAQKRSTRKLEIEAQINSISFDAAAKSPNLNLEGLTLLKKSLLEKTFDSLFKEDDDFTDEENERFEGLFGLAMVGAEKLIDSFMKNFTLEEENKTLETANVNLVADNKVLEAQTPGAVLNNDPSDMPFAEPQVQNVAPTNDLEKLVLMYTLLVDLEDTVEKVLGQIKEIEFTDESLKSIQSKVSVGSLPQVVEWTEKLSTWTKGKVEAYQNFLNNQNK